MIWRSYELHQKTYCDPVQLYYLKDDPLEQVEIAAYNPNPSPDPHPNQHATALARIAELEEVKLPPTTPSS